MGTFPSGAGADVIGRPMVTVASYPDYASAQRAVDYLSDNKFPVENSSIVGTNLSLVENVTGRLTTARAAMIGAASGAWFGLFIGLLFGLFVETNWLVVVLTGIVIGALWGAIFGAIAHAATRGLRDFTSTSSLQAKEYGLNVAAELADQARQLLSKLNWQASEPR
jgi:Heat induced stress protein YflT domain